MRSVYRNGVVQECAAEDLERARQALGEGSMTTYRIARGRSPAAAVAGKAERCGADMIIVPAGRGIDRWSGARRGREVQRRTDISVVVAA
jgi:hypothetical protein